MDATKPPRPPWWSRVADVLVFLVVILLAVSVAVSTWRLVFPRPSPPTYVCVYISGRGSTTVTGLTPCAIPP